MVHGQTWVECFRPWNGRGPKAVSLSKLPRPKRNVTVSHRQQNVTACVEWQRTHASTRAHTFCQNDCFPWTTKTHHRSWRRGSPCPQHWKTHLNGPPYPRPVGYLRSPSTSPSGSVASRRDCECSYTRLGRVQGCRILWFYRLWKNHRCSAWIRNLGPRNQRKRWSFYRNRSARSSILWIPCTWKSKILKCYVL